MPKHNWISNDTYYKTCSCDKCKEHYRKWVHDSILEYNKYKVKYNI